MTDPGALALPALAALISVTLATGVGTAVLRAAQDDERLTRAGQAAPVRLRALLAAPGARYRLVTSGALDAAGVAEQAGDAAGAERAFRELGLRAAYEATWRSADGETVVTTLLLEFAAAAGASRYAGGLHGAAAALRRPEPFTVPGLPLPGLADQEAGADGSHVQVVVMHRGTLAAVVVAHAASADPHPDLVALALRQYARLSLSPGSDPRASPAALH